MQGQRRPLAVALGSMVGEYLSLDVLGSGQFGEVHLARKVTSGELYALKFVPRSEQHVETQLREVLNHARLRHPHVIALHSVLLYDPYVVLAMEYAAGGTLLNFLNQNFPRGMAEATARWYFSQMTFGVDYMHKKGICNRDIKLENTVLGGAGGAHIVKICDFGLSKDACYQSMPDSLVGSPCYVAPEILSAGSCDASRYDGFKADVWSLGVVLYALLFCRMPFMPGGNGLRPSHERVETVAERVQRGQYEIPAQPPVSPLVQDLLSKIFVTDPARRLTLGEVMQHPWCRGERDLAEVNVVHMQQEDTSGVTAEVRLGRQSVLDMFKANGLIPAAMN